MSIIETLIALFKFLKDFFDNLPEPIKQKIIEILWEIFRPIFNDYYDHMHSGENKK